MVVVWDEDPDQGDALVLAFAIAYRAVQIDAACELRALASGVQLHLTVARIRNDVRDHVATLSWLHNCQPSCRILAVVDTREQGAIVAASNAIDQVLLAPVEPADVVRAAGRARWRAA